MFATIRPLFLLPFAALLLLSTLIAHAQHPSAINVATYNLRLNIAVDGDNAWPNRKEHVKALIRYHEWDLFGTQEGLPDQIDDLAVMGDFGYVGVGRDDGKRAGEFAAIFYRKNRFVVERNGDFWLSETPDVPSKGWDGRCCNRLATWAILRDKKTKKRFFVISAHFDHEGVIARRNSAHLMVKKIRAIAGKLPVLCLGDFNDTPESEPLQIFLKDFSDARAISKTQPYGPDGTFNNFKLDAIMTRRIDYILVNSRISVLKHATLTDSYAARWPSDHWPVVAKIVIR